LQTESRSTSGLWVVFVIVILFSVGITYVLTAKADQVAFNSSSAKTQSIIDVLQHQNQSLRQRLASNQSQGGAVLGLDPVSIYQKVSEGVVTVEGPESTGSILGSGFVVMLSSAPYVVTNYHVIHNLTSITVTFTDGNAYPARVVGSDGYSDLAVLNVSSPRSEFHPLTLSPSSVLKVGQPLVAIGNPYGLAGSMTFGIVSQLGRTIAESLAGNFPIADVIQFSAPINPGNSGGPLLTANATVVGITTAIVQSSQGVGFAIPSDTIERELPALVALGSYPYHPYVGIETADMNYQLAGVQGTNVTYGVLVESVVSGGPAATAGVRAGSTTTRIQGSTYTVGGDIIVSVNGTKIVNGDALSTYLDENALPGERLVLGIIRNGSPIIVDMVLGTRPAPPS
jgi:S1-C subfamily serine protease